MSTKDIDLLDQAGEALFGPDWQRAMSRLLEVNERTVRRWARGDSRISPGIWPELDSHMRERVASVRKRQGRVQKRAETARKEIKEAEKRKDN